MLQRAPAVRLAYFAEHGCGFAYITSDSLAVVVSPPAGAPGKTRQHSTTLPPPRRPQKLCLHHLLPKPKGVYSFGVVFTQLLGATCSHMPKVRLF